MYVNGRTMNINIPRMKLEDLKQYLLNILGTKIHALYYKMPHNRFSITVKLRNNYDMLVMFDISSAHYKLEIYIDHLGVDFIIAKYILLNASLAEMMNHVITNYTSESEDDKREVTQNDYTFNQMVEWAEQEHFEDEETKVSCPKIDLSSLLISNNGSLEESFGAKEARNSIVLKLQRELEAERTLAHQLLCNLTRYSEEMSIREVQITMLQSMPTMSLNSYGLHALLMAHEADIRTTNNIIRTRQEFSWPRGMMYYQKALKLQAFLDMAQDDDILQGYDAIERGNDTLSAQLDALADLKFTHVVSCQLFGS
ncbi:transposase, MuDR, MULE transposase domain protein [Tanacetum coccineum]